MAHLVMPGPLACKHQTFPQFRLLYGYITLSELTWHVHITSLEHVDITSLRACMSSLQWLSSGMLQLYSYLSLMWELTLHLPQPWQHVFIFHGVMSMLVLYLNVSAILSVHVAMFSIYCYCLATWMISWLLCLALCWYPICTPHTRTHARTHARTVGCTSIQMVAIFRLPIYDYCEYNGRGWLSKTWLREWLQV